ncbi:hemin importer ATP-binding subunit [Bacteroidales bacterium Barb7]|nr:hemin importer ATP-binding subunit [Bacteroidales bacterium Barb7]
MITNIKVENFKKLECISFPLSSSVVIIGPNNSGKSTIFQALCLWEIGIRNFIAASIEGKLNKNKNVTINRKDLVNSPVEDAKFLWTKRKSAIKDSEKKIPKQVILSIELEIEDKGEIWKCCTEFYYYNAESFSCKVTTGLDKITALYKNGNGIHFGFLQPMSGISSSEDKLTQGSIDRKLGEGKTAEVLRNICYEILYPEIAAKNSVDTNANWDRLYKVIKIMFGATLEKPEYIKSTGLIRLEYTEKGIKYDISSGGRGFLQTLLLFAYMIANPDTIFLLDEPDAHLEVIRQREAFQQINEIANETRSQLLIASHSEIVLDEAAEASKVIALIENQAFELNASTKKQSIRYIKKALTEIGWEKYYLAKLKGHVLYLEGSTDLQMLLTFASKLNHKAEPLLRFANVYYTADNVPNTAVSNYVALKEIFPELKGLALFDRIEKNIDEIKLLKVICWQRRELENYFACPPLLVKHAKLLRNIYKDFTVKQLEDKMNQAITDYTSPAYLKDPNDKWWNDTKLSDDWLDKIFPEFYRQLDTPIDFFKRDYYRLIRLMDTKDIPAEITDKLDAIYSLLK